MTQTKNLFGIKFYIFAVKLFNILQIMSINSAKNKT